MNVTPDDKFFGELASFGFSKGIMGLFLLVEMQSSLFVYFIVQILFHKSNGIQSVSSFKILNDVTVCILLDLRYLI